MKINKHSEVAYEVTKIVEDSCNMFKMSASMYHIMTATLPPNLWGKKIIE